MADIKPRYIPGTQINEAATGNIFLYVEAVETLKNGEEVAVDMQMGRAKHAPEVAGIHMPFGKVSENIPQGQFGHVLVKGATLAFAEAMKQRAAVGAKDAGLALPPGVKAQTRSPKATV